MTLLLFFNRFVIQPILYAAYVTGDVPLSPAVIDTLKLKYPGKSVYCDSQFGVRQKMCVGYINNLVELKENVTTYDAYTYVRGAKPLAVSTDIDRFYDYYDFVNYTIYPTRVRVYSKLEEVFTP